MVGGFFLGGLSSGFNEAEKMGIAERQQKLIEQQDVNKSAESQIQSTLKIAQETARAAADAGTSPQKIAAAIQPLIDSAAGLAASNPTMGAEYANRIRAMGTAILARPAAQDNTKHSVVQIGEEAGPNGITRKRYGVLEQTSGTVKPLDLNKDGIPDNQAAAVNPVMPQPVAAPTPAPAPAAVPVAAPSNAPASFGERFAALNPQTATDAGPSPAPAPGPQVAQLAPAAPVAGLSSDAVDYIARQTLAGNERAFSGTPRGKEGNAIRAAVMNRVTEIAKAEGITPEQINAANSAFKAFSSGQRKVGERAALVDLAATEFQMITPPVLAASERVDRTKYSDINKILLSWRERTGDENVVQLGAGINTLINVYSRAVSPTGQVTVSDKDHAREILQKAWSKGQFAAGVKFLQQEIDAALKSPKKALEHQRQDYLSTAPGAKQPPQSDPLGIR